MNNSNYNTGDKYYRGYSVGYDKGVNDTMEKYGVPDVVTKYIVVTQETLDRIKKEGKIV